MDYSELAAELLHKMYLLHRARPQKRITESLKGVMFILQFIAHNDCGVLPGNISSEMDVSSARVAAALNTLEDKGLVTREIDKSDRRRILVKLTPKGREITEKHELEIFGEMKNMLVQLGEHDACEYVRIMGRLAEIALKCTELLQ